MGVSNVEKNFGDGLRGDKRVEGRVKCKTITTHFKLLKHNISYYLHGLMNHKQIEGERANLKQMPSIGQRCDT